jgi:putative endonuclease
MLPRGFESLPLRQPNMYYVYVLEDEKGRYYKGFTKDLEKRVEQHNSGITPSTKRMSGDKKLVYFERFKDKTEALRRERFLKSGKGRDFLKDKMNEKAVRRGGL